MDKKHQEGGFSSTQKVLLILDVFKGQTVPSVLSKLKQTNIDYLFVPPNCTDCLQPLDVAVNKTVKAI